MGISNITFCDLKTTWKRPAQEVSSLTVHQARRAYGNSDSEPLRAVAMTVLRLEKLKPGIDLHK
jgi:hypothetical protein